ncbi:3196_t:CDS:2 [Funneliformis mosseae]|uniref:3196_t:CDS:1 n=1 Tax=Funneliformis mosseae TaxID=27381 RepID=A0A9N8VQH4_FUNMO|nr:3196_t:CDS:2 [Funneliformis mosseae]
MSFRSRRKPNAKAYCVLTRCQNKTHFYARFLPKYKVFYGNECVDYTYIPATPEQAEKINKALQPNQDNVIAEKSKVVAKLHNKMSPGYTNTVIDVKKYTQELMNKFEQKLNCTNFYISMQLGKENKLMNEREN